mgnify:CR=1 FL=1
MTLKTYSPGVWAMAFHYPDYSQAFEVWRQINRYLQEPVFDGGVAAYRLRKVEEDGETKGYIYIVAAGQSLSPEMQARLETICKDGLSTEVEDSIVLKVAEDHEGRYVPGVKTHFHNRAFRHI